MAKIISFRIYPETRNGFYFDVKVYPTVEAMRKAAANDGDFKDGRHYFAKAQACVRAYRKMKVDADGKAGWSKTLGTFYFHRKRLGTEIITHECTHAALRWAEAKKIDIADRTSPDYVEGQASANEEEFCYALGVMASQIVSKFYDHDLYK